MARPSVTELIGKNLPGKAFAYCEHRVDERMFMYNELPMEVVKRSLARNMAEFLEEKLWATTCMSQTTEIPYKAVRFRAELCVLTREELENTVAGILKDFGISEFQRGKEAAAAEMQETVDEIRRYAVRTTPKNTNLR